MTHCWVKQQKYVRNFWHVKMFRIPLVTPYHTTASHFPPTASCLPSPISSLLSLVSRLTSLFYCIFSPLFIIPLLLYPSLLETPIAWRRGEVDCKQEGCKITAGGRGVSLTASWGGRWLLGGEGWVWLPAKVEDDRRVERGEFDCLQGGRMKAGWREGLWTAPGLRKTARRRGVSLKNSRVWEWPLGREWWITSRTGGRWPLYGEGWVWPPEGVEEDCWVERGELDH